MVSFQRNGDFIGRAEHMQRLETKLCVLNKHCHVALVRLGALGMLSDQHLSLYTTISFIRILPSKTRIALGYASEHGVSDFESMQA